jgi:hypothetical protein
MNANRTDDPRYFDHLLAMFHLALADDGGLLEEETPLARGTREFFANNWAQTRDGLLARTRLIEVAPAPSPAPRVFEFTIHRPYKRKAGPDEPVELVPGPIRGMLFYRSDILLMAEDDGPAIAVSLADRWMFHPNFSRRHSMLCLGGFPGGPVPLATCLEHVYRIVSYANQRVFHPADIEAARYFALDPDAMMKGLEHVEPLY